MAFVALLFFPRAQSWARQLRRTGQSLIEPQYGVFAAFRVDRRRYGNCCTAFLFCPQRRRCVNIAKRKCNSPSQKGTPGKTKEVKGCALHTLSCTSDSEDERAIHWPRRAGSNRP